MTTGGSTGVKNPLEAMLSGIVQLQEVVADLAASKGTGSASASTSSPEVVRPGVTELVKLPSPTLEGALGFADWVHAIRPSLSDLSDSSGECWERLLSEAQDWYQDQYVPANPLARIRLKIPASTTDKESKWVRVKHRMEHLIIQSCPESVRSELSAARVSGVFPILCKLHTVYKPGGVAERSEALRQVQQPRPADSPIDAVLKLRTWRRWMTRLSDLGGSQPDAAVCIQALEAITSSVLRSLPNLAFRVNLVRASLNLDTQPTSTKVMEYFEHLLAELEGVSRVSEASPGGGTTAKGDVNKGVRQVEGRQATGSDATATPPKEAKGAKAPSTPSSPDSGKKLCKWFHEGKGCRRGKECKFQHDWNQIPKPERADRCITCGGHGHRKDSCPNGSGLAKRDDGASSAKASRGDRSPKSKSSDPGLRRVLTDAAGVLREALASGPGAAQASPGKGGVQVEGPQLSTDQGGGKDTPTMATAAKIQAQLEDLEARVLDGRPRVRAVSHAGDAEEEGTALLDSGATHAVLDSSATKEQALVPCTVSLAGDQKQVWHQTPGGSLVAPCNEEGSITQTILPLGLLVHQLGCSLRWSKKGGLQLIHPRLGRLRTSLKGGCPQLSKDQALHLVKELESAKLGELDGRLKRVQAQLSAKEGLGLEEAIDAFVNSGSVGAALALIQVSPFLAQVPSRIADQLAVDLEGINGWEAVKGLPFNRRVRKRLHQSHSWVLQLGTGNVDPVLKQMCYAQGYELVQLDVFSNVTQRPEVWKALSWAAYTGRVAGILAEAPTRTWFPVQVSEDEVWRHRSVCFPWGDPLTSPKARERVDADTIVALQPMWLWTVSSIARGEGIPMCQTQAVPPHDAAQPWLKGVVDPFATWSNCSRFYLSEVQERGHVTRPIEVCSNLGFSKEEPKGNQQEEGKEGLLQRSVWPSKFARNVTLGLFGSHVGFWTPKVPRVDAVHAEGLPAGEHAEGLPAGEHAEGLPAGEHAEGLPAGEHAEGLPAGEHAEGLPAGVHAEGLPAGVRAEGLPAGEHAEGLPTGEHAEGLPAGEHAEGLPTGEHAEGLPAGVRAEGLPAGERAEGLPAGERAEGLPAGERAEGLPAGVRAEGLPAGEHAEGLPAGVRAEGLPAGEHAEGLPAGERAEGLPAGERAEGLPAGVCAEGSLAGKVATGPSKAGAREEGPIVQASGSGGANPDEDGKPAAGTALSPKERERWKRHIAAHHLPFRKDCLQCVMSGALGLQHRRVKCPNMYALSFDLTGPFKEKGIDDRGGGYKYALVAGLRVPEVALPAVASAVPVKPKPTAPGKESCVPEAAPQATGGLDLEGIEWSGSEDSWLRADLELKGPGATAQEVDDEGGESEASCEEGELAPEGGGALDEGEDLLAHAPIAGPIGKESAEEDPWADTLGVADMSDESFDAALVPMTFEGANKVLRFVVPVKSRHGPHILAGLQEVITECHRLGYPVKVAHTDRAKELMSKATMEWLQSKLIQPSFTQGDDPKANGLAERLVGWVKARARLHLTASGLGLERWPSAMEFACAEHRRRLLQPDQGLPRFGQRVIFKSKHPTGKSKRPFVRWEHAVYLHPSPRTEGGHVLLREASNAFLVAKNVIQRPSSRMSC